MIRNEAEYQEAARCLAEEAQRFHDHRVRLQDSGLSDVEIKRAIDPLQSFPLQMKEEIEAYERLKRGEFDDLDNLRGLGHLLIASRIAQGLSQRELAGQSARKEAQPTTWPKALLRRVGTSFPSSSRRLKHCHLTRIRVEF